MSGKPKIVIIAGGLATRMKPITENIPKCLIDVNGTPLIEHQINFFKEHGYKDFIFCVAHLANIVKEYFGDGSKFGVNIEYSQEPKELLGSAGAVKLIEDIVKETIIIFYGDNLTNLNFDKFLKFHKDKKSKFTIFLRKCPYNYRGSSLITMNKDGQIDTFIEKPSTEERDKYKNEVQYINNGIYIMEPEVFNEIPEKVKYDFGKEVIPKRLQNGQKVFGYISDDFFIELGRVEKYDKFLVKFKGRKKVLEKVKAIFLDRDGVINKNIKDMKKPEQFEILKGTSEAIKKINDTGYLAVVVTNQPTISKGFLSFENMEKIHDKMNKELTKYNAHIDAIYMCPHHPEKGFEREIPELKIDCNCRKPKPGMITDAIRDYNIDIRGSWIIGDSLTDIVAGKNAGIKTAFIYSGGGSGSKNEKKYKTIKPDMTCHNLLDAIKNIIK
jgi:D-glycero-D-manno-heptose 1,7-bisphosphate phosphatase